MNKNKCAAAFEGVSCSIHLDGDASTLEEELKKACGDADAQLA